MNIQPLILPKKLLVALSGTGIAMIIGVFYAVSQGYPVDMQWLIIGLAMNFMAFVAVVIDLLRNPVKNKWTWVIILVTISILASFIYLIMRDKILGIESE